VKMMTLDPIKYDLNFSNAKMTANSSFSVVE
jgi:hypothetical protein